MLLKKSRPDYITCLVVLILVAFGIIMVFSASQYFAQQPPYEDSAYFLKKQLLSAVLGIVGMFFLMGVSYRKYRYLAWPALFVGLAMIALVLISGFGDESGGAIRWINLGFLRFQPSELMKLALVLFLAKSLSDRQDKLKSFWKGFVPYMLLLGIICFLVALEDLGTAIVIGGTTIIMLFCAGNKVRHLSLLVVFGIIFVVWAVIDEPYRLQRILTILDPWSDPQGSGYQTIQSLLALGSGGLTGVGLGAGGAKWYYLPERHTDFIFAIIGEELGLLGAVFLVVLFMMFTWRGLDIAWHTKDSFGSYLALGLTMMISLQALVNLAVVVGLLPVTGITLPFISYGGSSLVVSLWAIGLLLNISRYAELSG